MLIEAITTSLFIIGLYNSTSYELNSKGEATEKNVLWFIRFYVDKYIKEPFGKPIILCPNCMASLWGSIVYLFVFNHDIDNFSDFINLCFFIFIVSALNNLLQR